MLILRIADFRQWEVLPCGGVNLAGGAGDDPRGESGKTTIEEVITICHGYSYSFWIGHKWYAFVKFVLKLSNHFKRATRICSLKSTGNIDLVSMIFVLSLIKNNNHYP